MDQIPHHSLGAFEAKLDEQTLNGLIRNRSGITDVPCPLCGPYARAPSNQRRKVLRVWNNEGFLTYKCARCGAQGCATGDRPSPAIRLPPPDTSSRKALAERLWGSSVPIQGTLVETYLDARKCYLTSRSIKYLPANDVYHPTMISKFQGTSAVHLTRLKHDGTGKAGTDHDKVMIGPCTGFPIVVRSMEWSSPLIICEGIEEGLSLALCSPNWTVWAAGSAGHIPSLVPADREAIVMVDFDKAGINTAKRCLSINPQTKIIRFPKGLDANDILVHRGLNALRDFVTRHQPFHR